MWATVVSGVPDVLYYLPQRSGGIECLHVEQRQQVDEMEHHPYVTFYLQQRFLFAATFLFAAPFYLQQLFLFPAPFFILQQPFLFAATFLFAPRSFFYLQQPFLFV